MQKRTPCRYEPIPYGVRPARLPDIYTSADNLACLLRSAIELRSTDTSYFFGGVVLHGYRESPVWNGPMIQFWCCHELHPP